MSASLFSLPSDLESTSKDVLRTFLKDNEQEDVERFFNEWKNTYSNGGPFETKRQLKKLYKELTNPSHFHVRIKGRVPHNF